jgi:hypothetical protein
MVSLVMTVKSPEGRAWRAAATVEVMDGAFM